MNEGKKMTWEQFVKCVELAGVKKDTLIERIDVENFEGIEVTFRVDPPTRRRAEARRFVCLIT